MGDMAVIEDNIIKKSIFPQFFCRLNKLPNYIFISFYYYCQANSKIYIKMQIILNAFSYCSWGSQGKNTEVGYHSLLPTDHVL